MRRGFDIQSYFRFSPGSDGQQQRIDACVASDGNDVLMKLTHAPSAELWSINHGWRRGDEKGFPLDLGRSRWMRKGDEPKPNSDIRSDVRLFVRGTSNVVLFYADPAHMPDHEDTDSVAFLHSLQYALTRGICARFQVEQSELGSQVLGSGEWQGVVMWEAAEGGLGVLRRLVDEPNAIAQVAQHALEIMHFDPATGDDRRPPEDEDNGCARACYDCLLSYRNQRDHRIIDRHAIVEFMKCLAAARTSANASDDPEEHYKRLRAQTDVNSDLERKFLDHLYTTKRRLPDTAQHHIEEAHVKPDFFVKPQVCIFCDGSVHDEPQQAAEDDRLRKDLKSRGCRVIVIRYDQDMEEQISQYRDVFGEGSDAE